MSRTPSLSHGTDGVPADPARRRRTRILLLGIVASFAIPLLLAIIWLQVVRSGAAGDLGNTSRGDLIRPAVPLEPFTLVDAKGQAVDLERLRGIWTMLYLPEGECAELCRTNLYNMRQVRLALNQRMKRVQRLVVPPTDVPLEPSLVAEHPGLIVATGDATERAAFVAQVDAAQAAMAPAADAVYLIDPFGNLMMRFAPTLSPSDMLKDVKHLLEVSQIG